MPYLMAGFPTLAESVEVGRACVHAGADLIELGVPYTDPLADGPVIHAAGTAALRAGVRTEDVLELARSVAPAVPVIVMCYANPIFRRGLERFADTLVDAGACGLIVPDLPLEETEAALAACDERGLALVPLVAPTTPDVFFSNPSRATWWFLAGCTRVPRSGFSTATASRANTAKAS